MTTEREQGVGFRWASLHHRETCPWVWPSEALSDGGLREAIIEEMLKWHEGIPSVYGASPLRARRANVPAGLDKCPLQGP